MKAVVAALATAAVLAGAAWASNITPQQFAKLNARVVKLEKSNAQLASFVSQCLSQYAGVTEFGGNDTNGYTYRNDNGSTSLTAALDLEAQGTPPEFRLVAFPAKCKDVTPVDATP